MKNLLRLPLLLFGSLFLLLFSFSLSVYGQNFTEKGIRYTVNSASATPEVKVVAQTPKYEGAVIIPSSVTHGGTSYAVTSVESGAFSACNNLTAVRIPASVTALGNDAFKDCSSLSNVSCANSSPGSITLGTNVFGGSTPVGSAMLLVPSAAVSTYGSAAQWSAFGRTYALSDFITKWKTTTAGRTVTFPLFGSYNINWGDGSSGNGSGTATHTYSSPGTYTVSISGGVTGVSFAAAMGITDDIISIEQWGSANWTNLLYGFMGCGNLKGNFTDAPNISGSLRGLFFSCRNFNGNASNWDVSAVTSMAFMFYGTAFNQDISNWNVSNVTDMEAMFIRTPFNQNINNWNVSNVTNMALMFFNTPFNQPLNNWNVSRVTNMKQMFYDTPNFNQDLSSWNVSAVTNMEEMFSTAPYHSPLLPNLFNQDLSNWNVSAVTNMKGMFKGATAFNQDLSSWDVSAVTDMTSMFEGATAFDQNLSAWNITNVQKMKKMFKDVTLSTNNYDALLDSWNAKSLKQNVRFHAGNSKYCKGEAAKRNMTLASYRGGLGWGITDGGRASTCQTPQVLSFSPANNAINVAFGSNLVITFDRNVTAKTANIFIYDLSNTLIETIPANAANVTVSGATVTIDPTNLFKANEFYHIRMGSSVFENASVPGYNFVGVYGFSWRFSTQDKITPTITFPDLTKTYGDADFDLNATSNSLATPTYNFRYGSAGSAAMLSGTQNKTVSLMPPSRPGTARLRASFPATDHYKAATKEMTLTIQKKNLTITGLTAADKNQDGNNTATLSGTATLNGVIGSDNVNLAGTPTVNFNNANAGINKPVTVSGYYIWGPDANKYTLTQPAGLTANIYVELSVTGLTANNKVYDGNKTTTLSGTAALVGVSSAHPNVSLDLSSASAEFDNKHAGNNKDVIVTGYTLSGTDAGYYSIDSQLFLRANITPKNLTISGLTADDKNHDGNTTATLSGTATLNGVLSSDYVSLSGTVVANFNDATVGNNKPVTVSGYTLSGLDRDNYALTQPTGLTANILSTVTQLTITGLTANNKVYNGNNTATLSGTAALNGIDPAHPNVTLNSGSAAAAFADKNAGSGKTVTVSGYTLGGADASHYSLTQPTGLTADITPKNLTISGLTANSKPHDGTTTATLSGTATLNGLIGSDNVSLSGTPAANFNNASAGSNKPVTVSGYTLSGTDRNNYTLTQPTGLTASIAMPLTITGLTVNNKVYDGNNTATLSGTPALSGVNAAHPNVTLNSGSASAAFADKNAGSGKAVTVSGYTLGGADASHYFLNQPTGLTADITPKNLTISGLTANNKPQDGNTTATLSGTATLNGVVSPDNVSLSGTPTANFNNASAGSNKPVTVSGYTLSGPDRNNYTLTQPTGLTANITSVIQLTITGLTVNNKVYDGNTTATLGGTAALSGVNAAHPNVTLISSSASAAFADKNAGSGKTVTVGGYTLSGTDVSHYFLNQPTGLTADITAVPLTVVADAKSKVYGGADPVLTYNITAGSLKSGDALSGSLNRAVGEDVGAYAINQGTLTAGTNYNLSYTSANLTITTAPLTITADNKQKPNDGNVFPTSDYTVTCVGFVFGETVSDLNNALTFGGSSQTATAPGTYPIVPGGVTSTNYLITFVDGTLSIGIQDITGVTLPSATFVYDGSVKKLTLSGGLPTGANVTYSGNNHTDAGTYQVSATITAPLHNPLTLSATLVIKKAPIAGISLANKTVTYDGKAHALAISGALPVGANVHYTNNNQTDAGDYQVTANINGGTNYESSVLNAKLTIEKADIKGISFDGKTVFYSGSPHTLAIGGTLPKGTSVRYINNSKADVGVHKVVAKIDGGKNYKSFDLTATLTIREAVIAGISFEDKRIPYDGNTHNLSISGNLPAGVQVNYLNNGHSEAGTYEVIAQVDGGKKYKDFTIKAKLIIEKAAISGISLKDKTVRYDGNTHSLEISGTLPAGTSVSYQNNGQTNGGVYEVAATINGGKNYKNLTLNAKLIIEKLAITGLSLAGKRFMFDGSTKFLALEGTLPAGATLSYKNNGQVNAGIYTVVAEINGGKNYQSTQLTAKLTIDKATISGISLKDKTVRHNGKTHSLSIGGKLPAGAGVSYLNNNKQKVGTYEVIAKIRGGQNYHDLELKATLKILKAQKDPITGILFSGATFVYDGQTKSLKIGGKLPAGTSVKYLNNAKTDAGTYTVTALIDGGDNYIDKELKAKLTIEKAHISGVSFTDKTVAYNGKKQHLTLKGTLPAGASVKYLGNGKIAGGTYEVTAQINGGKNYKSLTLKAKLTIKRKDKAPIANIAFADKTFTYNGKPHKLSLGGKLPAGTSVSYQNNTKTDAGTYEVIAKIDGGENYKSYTLKARLTIEKAAQTLSWTQEIDICGAQHLFSLTATSSSGLPVSYQSTAPEAAAVEGSQLTLLQRDKINPKAQITATQAGNKNYRPAKQISKPIGRKLYALVSKHWEDVLFFDNSSRRFAKWQWYKNNTAVSGETRQYYHENQPLNGIYHAQVTDQQGEVYETCPLNVKPNKKAGGITLSPNPVAPGSTLTVTANYTTHALKGAKLYLILVGGQQTQTLEVTQTKTEIQAPKTSGLYIVRLRLPNGKQASSNLLVR